MGELNEDDRLATSEIEDPLAEGIPRGLVQKPINSRVGTARHVFGEEPYRTAEVDHSVDEFICAEVVGVDCRVRCGKPVTSAGIAKVLKGADGSLIGSGPPPLIGVGRKPLNADEKDDISAIRQASGGLRRHKRTIGDRDEEKALVTGYEVKQIRTQERFAAGDNNSGDSEVLRLDEKGIELLGRELIR